MKKTTLISIIGKPRGGSYKPVTYQLNGKNYPASFFFLPLLQHYRPQQFFLLGTRDSIWDKVEEARLSEGFEYQKVEIPFGMNDAEVWQIFETIVSLPLRETELIIDITHGFRAIPIAVFLAALYFQAVREDVKVLDVLYGVEAKGPETGIAPVVHLHAYLDMNEWIRAATRFIRYGDAALLLEMLKEQDHNRNLHEFLSRFQTFSDNLQLNFVSQIVPSLKNLMSTYSGLVRSELSRIPPFKLLEEPIKKRFQLLLQNEPEWKKQWRIARWFFENRQFSQSIVVLREVLITFICELSGLKILIRQDREEKGKELLFAILPSNAKNRRDGNHTTRKKIEKPVLKIKEILPSNIYDEWGNLLDEVVEARNRVGHALMRGGGSKSSRIDPQQQILELEALIENTGKILQSIDDLPPATKSKLMESFADAVNILEAKNVTNIVFLLANEGIHPIIEDLKKQYGPDIRYEVVTRGNVDLNREAEIARRVKEIVEAHHGAEFVVVPSGLPYIATVVYNTLLQITSKHPLYLQLDREAGRYIEKTLDPRKLML